MLRVQTSAKVSNLNQKW